MLEEVLVGGALAAAGGALAALYQGQLATAAEKRQEARSRADRLRDSKLTALRAAMVEQAALAEHIRATAAGESPEQPARLRQQLESAANVDSDPTLLDAEAVRELGHLHMRLMERGPGTGVTKSDLEPITVWMARLAVSYKAAVARILSE